MIYRMEIFIAGNFGDHSMEEEFFSAKDDIAALEICKKRKARSLYRLEECIEDGNLHGKVHYARLY